MPIIQGLQADFPFETAVSRGAAVATQLTRWEPENWPVANDWQPLVSNFLQTGAAGRLGRFIEGRLAVGATIYPPQPFRALALTPLANARVVILGQDPYHGEGQAQGLAFSVATDVAIPPSLRNIFKEIARGEAARGEAVDRARPGATAPQRDGSLARWAQQGVLLLNTCLTVEAGQPASHAKQGWEVLTDEIIKAVWLKSTPVVFMLWGAHAQTKRSLLMDSALAPRHLVLTANHPSPLSALRPPQPFMGCGHFGLANDFLAGSGQSPVAW